VSEPGEICFPNNGKFDKIFFTFDLSAGGTTPMAVACPLHGGSTS
jgi:hypothetical protein